MFKQKAGGKLRPARSHGGEADSKRETVTNTTLYYITKSLLVCFFMENYLLIVRWQTQWKQTPARICCTHADRSSMNTH